MTHPDDVFGEEASSADVADQLTPVEAEEQDTWSEASRVTAERSWEASEADLIDQSIEVPLPDDEPEL
ncbi:hypothetical protein [uncultured Mycolicibacterium sp.]|uniref:hypothetical protein n=1 Tax=uncultured Mycolicibacterium sp. TaxID=2320817 RepID=UPI002617F2B4|nr:hypothetical protein [uncultured Mycolicibacterium sp.]